MRTGLGAVVALCLAAAAGCGSDPITVTGQVSVPMLDPDVTVSRPVEGDRCTAAAGYNDIAAGGQVVVTDGSGKTLGAAPLGEGRMHSPHPTGDEQWIGASCVFAFRVPGVDGADRYRVHVGGPQRGAQELSKDEAGKPIQLTVG